MWEGVEVIESARMNTSPHVSGCVATKKQKKRKKDCFSAHNHTLWLYIEEKEGGKKKEKECPETSFSILAHRGERNTRRTRTRARVLEYDFAVIRTRTRE